MSTSKGRRKQPRRPAARRRRRAPLSGTIVVTARANPRRPRTAQHDRFAVLLRHRGKSVATFLARGGDRDALNYAVEQGHARVTGK